MCVSVIFPRGRIRTIKKDSDKETKAQEEKTAAAANDGSVDARWESRKEIRKEGRREAKKKGKSGHSGGKRRE